MKGMIVSTSPYPPPGFFSHNRYNSGFLLVPSQSQVPVLKTHKKGPTFFVSSSSSSPIVEQKREEDSVPVPAPSAIVDSVGNGNDALPFSGCKGCGRDQIERGCNSEGRIQGGIATIPGFGWWPIKAFRPCPGFLASGGNYRRRGQSMDEMTSGGGKRG